ncbi:Macrolide export ATP-binding/permease protein MacB [Pirellulimonas nuda]|uniref:Macrolide export ATP-binding/permease protein MacB n=2 Tax=Pirellulimonas nuda TaxID=2528009 RepID=A0A518D6E0_9BACT|nr:Macrolide export ATP-binding/permease protein MacB [Pirellulimonas nuda]
MADFPSDNAAIATRGLSHTFGAGSVRVKVLHDIDLSIDRGEVVILMGPSGSGKTTLLTLVGCLRSVQSGSAQLLGQELAGADDPTLMRMRRRVGFIFQAHNLHESLTAIENVRMGLEVHGPRAMRGWRPAAQRVLDLVGLEDRLDFLPEKLSGGQKQRVAVARALVGNPDVVFADEPTAALDSKSGHQVMQILRSLADQRGTTVFVVTHDHRVLDLADRIVQMEEGRIVDDGRKAS